MESVDFVGFGLVLTFEAESVVVEEVYLCVEVFVRIHYTIILSSSKCKINL